MSGLGPPNWSPRPARAAAQHAEHQRDQAQPGLGLEEPEGMPRVRPQGRGGGQRKDREVKRLGEDLQADVDRERNEILQRAGLRMTELVKKLADEKGLDIVIDSTNTVSFKPAFEVTADATAAYDKAYPLK